MEIRKIIVLLFFILTSFLVKAGNDKEIRADGVSNLVFQTGGKNARLSISPSGIINLPGLTTDSVPYINASGNFVTNPGLLFDGSTLSFPLAQNNVMIGNVSGVATAGLILDVSIDNAANITGTKLGTGAVDNTELNRLDGLAAPIITTTSTSDISNKTFLDALLLTELVSTPATPSAGLKKVYCLTDDKCYHLNDAGAEVELGTGGATASTPQIVRVATGNGHGSTNTSIRRFSVVISDIGTDIDYLDSASNGATFTVNADGSYIAYYNDERNSVVARVGVSIDSTQLTTTIRSIIQADRACISEAATPEIASCTAVMNLSAGAVVRAHTGGAVTGGTRTSFTIVQVEKF